MAMLEWVFDGTPKFVFYELHPHLSTAEQTQALLVYRVNGAPPPRSGFKGAVFHENHTMWFVSC